MCLRQLLVLPLCFFTLLSCAQPENTQQPAKLQQVNYSLGTKNIILAKQTFGESKSPFFIQLHHNEHTAAMAVINFLQQQGGTFLSIQNAGSRYIGFSSKKRKHLFDPNRVFTDQGIRKNLQLLSTYTTHAALELKKFRMDLLRLIPDSTIIIAVHNNTDGQYSIHSYLTNTLLKEDAAQVHINPAKDSDDFFITTHHGVFKKLVAANYNCVWHNQATQNDDGSLGFYLGSQNRAYVNVEAQAGHLEEQSEMLQVLHQVLLQDEM